MEYLTWAATIITLLVGSATLLLLGIYLWDRTFNKVVIWLDIAGAIKDTIWWRVRGKKKGQCQRCQERFAVENKELETFPDDSQEVLKAAIAEAVEYRKKELHTVLGKKEALIASLDRIRQILSQTGHEEEIDVILHITDRIEGFCHPDDDIKA